MNTGIALAAMLCLANAQQPAANDLRRVLEKLDLEAMRAAREARNRGDHRKAVQIAETLARRCDAEIDDPVFCASFWNSVAIEAHYAFDEALARFANSKATAARKPAQSAPTDAFEAYQRIRWRDATLDIAAARAVLLAAAEPTLPETAIGRADQARSLSALATLAIRDGRWDIGEPLFEQALGAAARADTLRTKDGAKNNHFQYVDTLFIFITETQDIQRWPDAERLIRQYLALNPGSNGHRVGLAKAVLAQGRQAEGIQLWREALAHAATPETAASDPWLADMARHFAELLATNPQDLPEARQMLKLATGIIAHRQSLRVVYDAAALAEQRNNMPIFHSTIRINWALSQTRR